MKRFFACVLYSLLGICAIKAQKFEWAKRAGSYAFDLGYGVASDAAGNVYISGKYEMNANFGGTYVGCAGNHDIYTAKYGPDGSFKWVRTAGGTSGDYTHALTADDSGNTYLTGEFENTTKWGSTGPSMTAVGGNDVFVSSYNTNGDLRWAKRLGGGGKNDQGLGISQSNGNVYVCGKFEMTAWFSGGTAYTTSGGRDIFFAKYTTDGTLLWVKKAGGPGDDEAYAITSDADGNFYMTGYFSQTANFNGIYLTSTGSKDIFIAKYDTNGNIIWARKAGGSASDYGMGIKIDNAGRLFLTGGFRTNTKFGSISLWGQGGDADIFVARYTSNGDVVWARKAGGRINDYGRALALDSSSNLFITGNFGLEANFGGQTVYGADSAEIYVASWDMNGNFKWVLKVGGPTDDPDPGRFLEMGLSICTDPSGNVITSGAYRYDSYFGSTLLKEWDHTEVYVTKINPYATARSAPLIATLTPSKKAGYCSGGSVVLSTNDNPNYLYYWYKDGQLIRDAHESTYEANTDGTYTVKLYDGYNFSTSPSTEVSAEKNIPTEIEPVASLFCKEGSSELTATAGRDYIYQWKRNGEIIPGANNQTYIPTEPGEYQVRIIQGSCFVWSPITRIDFEHCAKVDTSVDAIIHIPNDQLAVKIFPNPNSGLFTIELTMPGEQAQNGLIRVELIDEIGQVVYYNVLGSSGNKINEHIELDKEIPTGVYFLKVTAGNKVENTRMLLTR